MEPDIIKVGDIVYILEVDKDILSCSIRGIVTSISHSDLNNSDLYFILDKNNETHGIYYPNSNNSKYLVTRKEYIERLRGIKKYNDYQINHFQAIGNKINDKFNEEFNYCASSGDHLYGEGCHTHDIIVDQNKKLHYVEAWKRCCTCCGHVDISYTKPDWFEEKIYIPRT